MAIIISAVRFTDYKSSALYPSRELLGYYHSSALRTDKPIFCAKPSEVTQQTRRGILNELTTGKLEDYKRVIFYALVAGEGLLLDRVNLHWRQRYFVDK